MSHFNISYIHITILLQDQNGGNTIIFYFYESNIALLFNGVWADRPRHIRPHEQVHLTPTPYSGQVHKYGQDWPAHEQQSLHYA